MTAGALADPGRLPHADRRRPQRRRPALAEPRGDVRPRPGPEGGDAGDGRPTPTTCWSRRSRDPNPVVFVENRRLYGDARRRSARIRCRSARRASRAPATTSPSSPGARCCATASRRPRSCSRLARGDRPALAGAARHGHGGRVGAQRTGRLLIVHEAVQDFGAGAEIAARIARRAVRRAARARCAAWARRRCRCPSARSSRRSLLPGSEVDRRSRRSPEGGELAYGQLEMLSIPPPPEESTPGPPWSAAA